MHDAGTALFFKKKENSKQKITERRRRYDIIVKHFTSPLVRDAQINDDKVVEWMCSNVKQKRRGYAGRELWHLDKSAEWWRTYRIFDGAI